MPKQNTQEGKAPYHFLGVPVEGSERMTAKLCIATKEFTNSTTQKYISHKRQKIAEYSQMIEDQSISKVERDMMAEILEDDKRELAELEAETETEETDPDNSFIDENILPLLGVTPEDAYERFFRTRPDTGFVEFKRGEDFFAVDFVLVSLPQTLCEFTESLKTELLENGVENLLRDEIPDSDGICLDPETGISYAVRVTTRSREGGYLAEDVQKFGVKLYSPNDESGGGLVLKINKAPIITARERAVIEGIRNDPELNELGISAPEIYGVLRNKMVMESLSHCVSVSDLPEEKQKELLPRIIKATSIVEKNTPIYLISTEINEAALNNELIDYFLRGCEKTRKQLADLDEAKLEDWQLEAMEDSLQVLEGKKAQLKARKRNAPEKGVPANVYFENWYWDGKGKSLDLIAAFGDAHKNAVEYIKESGMMDTWLSDSRLTNWLYDEKTGVLYKIDENAPAKSSRYGCLARIADFQNCLPEEQRDQLLDEVLLEQPEGEAREQERKDAFLSLYVINMQTAYIGRKWFENSKSQDHYNTMKARLERAKGYIERISDPELAREFKDAVQTQFMAAYADIFSSPLQLAAE